MEFKMPLANKAIIYDQQNSKSKNLIDILLQNPNIGMT